MNTNYFTCTLGEAAQWHSVGQFRDINTLIQEQSKNYPKLPAVGFFRAQQAQHDLVFEHKILTFRQLHRGVLCTAQLLSESLKTSHGNTLALLCSSSPEFLFTWLGCIALGYSVLLVAPECSPQDVAHLCSSCSVSELIVDAPNRALAEEAFKVQVNGAQSSQRCIPQPFEGKDVFEVLDGCASPRSGLVRVNGSDTAYLHHTSGTSGTPKPIMQSHHGAVGALPTFDGSNKATFTTTPLFHGGPADVFRAWTSDAMIWLFPSKDVPITASNVVKCLDCAQQAAASKLAPTIKYFASVPYVLESMGSNDEALRRLQAMDLVSVGGAALSQDVGDSLVEQGINLVSRFGSAECGFLLSSHRSYEKDKEWQYLRLADHSPYLAFEPRDDDLSELVVLQHWPHMAKTNRSDGSYATSDLFEPHPSIEGAWKYHSRADAQLTLATGKKFDADQLERSLLLGSDFLADVFVFGNGRPYPGALLFRSQDASELTDAKLIDEVLPLVERVNTTFSSHAAIAQSMLIPLPYSKNAIDRSSKGTVLRRRVEKRYQDCISNAYKAKVQTEGIDEGKDLLQTIHDIVIKAVPRRPSVLTDTTDLYSFGVDSIAGMHIRRALQTLLPEDAKRLPMDIIEDCGSIARLAGYIDDIRNGHRTTTDGAETHYSVEMCRLADEFSNFAKAPCSSYDTMTSSAARQDKEVVLLTGATGALGAHVLDLLRQNAAVTKIYCLVRGSDPHAAHERVRKALFQRKLSPLHETDPKIIVLSASLDRDDLGLDSITYAQILRETTTILHLAWSVNFRMKLRSFAKDSIAGLRNLIQLALRSPRPTCPRLAFCSSTASSLGTPSDPVPEAVLADPSSASQTGYARSKWVGEQICHRANEHTRLRGRVSILRVGQLSGDSKTGVWNPRDAIPMMLSTVELVGCLPDLGAEALGWLPVDVAAMAMVQGVLRNPRQDALGVFHVLNNSPKPTWNDLLRSIGGWTGFKIVPVAQWIEQLEKAMREGSDHPSLQLVDHWKSTLMKRDDQASQPKAFSMSETAATIPIMRKTYPLDSTYFHNMWKWIETTMIIGQSKKYAYSTLITRASYLAGVIILAYTLRKRGSQYPLIVFYTSGLSAAAIRVLESEADALNIIPKLCDPLLPPGHDKMTLIAQRFADTWTKLRVFDIYDYDAVCYLDADMAIFNNNMDEIFVHLKNIPDDHIAANHICCCNLDRDPWAPDDWRKENCAYTPLSHPSALTNPTPVTSLSRPTHKKLNGGMFLYRPTRDLWNSMMDFFNKSEELQHYMFPDQDFLADFFHGCWQSVGWQWNAIKTMRYWHPDMWRDSEVRCLHYIVDKPWAARISSDGRAGYKGRDGETHRWWWAEYLEWQDENLRVGKTDVVEAVAKYVASGDARWGKDSDMIAISPPSDTKS